MLSPALASLLVVLIATFVATSVLGGIAQRLGQPAVLGELVAGVVLGRSLLHILNPADPTIVAFAELGLLILLFEIGLRTDLHSLLRLGGTALMVALVGVVLPFVLGYALSIVLGLSTVAAIVCGAALTATSIGISARVLSDLQCLDSREGQVVLGAAVLDDVVGLVILSVVTVMVANAVVSGRTIGASLGASLAFLLAAVLAGWWIGPALLRAVDATLGATATMLMALAFALALSRVAGMVHTSPILGAFAAGLVLHRSPQRTAVEHRVASLGRFFVPIFFAAVGAAVDVRSIANPLMLGIIGVLTVAAVVGKFLAGYAPWWFRGDKALIGMAMIPRGEVGLIFAQMGLATTALSEGLYSAVTVVVLLTTLIGPLLLGRVVSRSSSRTDGGIDDLVAGARTV